MNNRCPNCGAENSMQARFCTSCGARLETSHGVSDAVPVAGNNQHPVHQKSSPSMFPNEFSKENFFKDTEKEPCGPSQNPIPNADDNLFSDGNASGSYEEDNTREPIWDTRERSRDSSEFHRDHRRTSSPKQKHTLTIVLITLMVVVVIAAAIVVVLAIQGKNQNDKVSAGEGAEIAANDEKSTKLSNAETYYVTKAVSYVSMRSEADSKSSIVGELYNGNSVKVLSKSGDYWYIYSEDLSTYGYIDSFYLTPDRDSVVYGEKDSNSGSQRMTGYGNPPQNYEFVRYAYVNSGYLALRSEQSSSDSNIIGKLYNYYPVQVISSTGTYWYVYSADLGMYGYVNSNYLIGESSAAPNNVYYPDVHYVSVSSGYLALRNAQSFDSSNEIGKLYNGDRVEVVDYSGTYWYVYAPTLGMYGYVNSEYLVQ